jgi:hypothetical protein
MGGTCVRDREPGPWPEGSCQPAPWTCPVSRVRPPRPHSVLGAGWCGDPDRQILHAPVRLQPWQQAATLSTVAACCRVVSGLRGRDVASSTAASRISHQPPTFPPSRVPRCRRGHSASGPRRGGGAPAHLLREVTCVIRSILRSEEGWRLLPLICRSGKLGIARTSRPRPSETGPIGTTMAR